MAEGAQAALQIGSIFLGGGAVQLIVAVFRRRSELHEIDARADSITASIADQLIIRLGEENQRLAARAVATEARLEAQVTQLRADLEDCRAEVVRLRRRLDGVPADPT